LCVVVVGVWVVVCGGVVVCMWVHVCVCMCGGGGGGREVLYKGMCMGVSIASR